MVAQLRKFGKPVSLFQDMTFIPEDVLEAVCKVFPVDREDLLSESRLPNITQPRHIAMYLIHVKCGLSLRATAAQLNRTDHTTVLNSIKVCEAGPEDLMIKRVKEEMLKIAIRRLNSTMENDTTAPAPEEYAVTTLDDFQENCLKTLNRDNLPKLQPHDLNQILQWVEMYVTAAKALELLKKFHFHQKPLPVGSLDLLAKQLELILLNPEAIQAERTDLSPEELQLLMVVLGIGGESGESVSEIKDALLYNRGGLNANSAALELLDLQWYATIGVALLGKEFSNMTGYLFGKLFGKHKNGFTPKV